MRKLDPEWAAPDPPRRVSAVYPHSYAPRGPAQGQANEEEGLPRGVLGFALRPLALPSYRHHQRRHPGGGFLRKGGQTVAVAIKGDGDARVPEPLADHLRMNAGREGQGGIGVPKIMEPDAG